MAKTISIDTGDGNELCAGLQPISVSDAAIRTVMDCARRHGEVWIYCGAGKSERVSSRMSQRTVARLLRKAEG